MDCSQVTYRAGLQQLTTVAQSLKSSAYAALCKAGKQPLSQPIQDVPIDVPSLLLPIPNHITSDLVHTGCPVPVAQSLSHAFIRSANEIRSNYELTFSQTCKRMARGPTINLDTLSIQLKNLGSALERQYEDRIQATKQFMLSRVRFLPRTPHASWPPKQKPTFNQEFVPLLEKYFEFNAYPSAPDRAALARKSMMTPRQIEVWYQNHRNRAKKEGKVLKRLTTDPLPLQLPLESLEQKMPFFIIPPNERKNIVHVETSDSESSDDGVEDIHLPSAADLPSLLNIATPPHAFPTTYSSSCSYNPFPCKTGQCTFPAPVWMRSPATPRPAKVTLALDDFIIDFTAKLVLRETSCKRQAGKSPNVIERDPWYSATRTVPPPAPHPAFIRSSISLSVTSNTVAPLPTVSAPSTHLHPFRSPSPFSPLTSLVPPAATGPSRRKLARLPKRIPRNGNLAYHSGKPDTSAGSLSPPTSRMPSLTSIASSNRRSSSSLSCSSGPSTPSSSPTSSAKRLQLPYVSESGWDPQNEGGLFDDFMDPVSAVVGYHIDGMSSCQKEQVSNVDLMTFSLAQ